MNTTASSSEVGVRPPKVLNVALWAAQVLLALGFGMAGLTKLTVPMEQLAQQLVWPGALPPPLVRFIGACELAGALGLILPAAARFRPALTPLAATGLLVMMVLAIAFHLSRGETQALPINVTLGALAAFVAWGRFRKAPLRTRA